MSLELNFEPPNHEQLSFIMKQLGTTEKDIEDTVASLRSWLEMQPHLPDAIDDDRIKNMYINCKCSVERTKEVLDAYFSLKHKVPELLMGRDPQASYVASACYCGMAFVMPRLTPKCLRVVIATCVKPDASLYNPIHVFKTILMWQEVAIKEDCSLGDVIVFDTRGVTPEHVFKTGVNTLRAVETTYRTAYRRRIEAIHLVTDSKVVDMIMTVLKTALPQKLGERIMTHSSSSKTLLDHIPAEFLPEELGGSAGTAELLRAATMEKISAYRPWFLEQDKFISDETRRPPGSTFIHEMFGVDGSFKKLDVD